MMSTKRPAEPDAQLIEHLARGGTVVTATRRQSRLLVALFNRQQLGSGNRVWRTADVVPFPAWATGRWNELTASRGSLPVLLTESHAEWPWRAHALPGSDSLFDARDLARSARRAWTTLRRHGGAVSDAASLAATRDHQAFAAWAAKVERELESMGWLDPGMLEVALAAQAHQLDIGRPLVFAGFRETTPALRALTAALSGRGWPLRFAPVAGEPGEVALCASSEPAAEVDALLAWLRLHLAQGPERRLAVVIGDLSARRVELERAFESVLQPELELPGSCEQDRLFDFAGGTALASLGIVDVALACLDAADSRLDLALATRLLRNRYIGLDGEQENRIRLDLALRRQGTGSWPLSSVVTRARAAHCPGFARALEESAAILRSVARPAAADRWATAFGAVLAAWGWPGERPLASDEYQAAQAFREHLTGFAGLARVAPALDRTEARAELRHLASSPFQPERGEAAVVVYDTPEAPGLRFDGLWISGMTSSDWPPAAAPDPFLPVGLQERLGMPGVTAASSLSSAVQVTGAWVGSATEVVFSWPEQRDDARLEPSRILPGGRTMRPGPRTATRTLIAAGGGELRRVLDAVPGISDGPATNAGARILELQAKCPFRAFAETRLAAMPLEEGSAGVDARIRGLVLHRTLELLTRSLPDRSSLAAAGDGRLAEALGAALDRALEENLPPDVGVVARSLEQEWQLASVNRFLETELQREDFEIVATEQRLEGTLGRLPFRLRVDRVDRVGDGLVIIDYKTGRPSTTHWRGARPDAPQLPLYAVLRGPEVQGVAFAAVGPERASYRGIASHAGLMPGLEEAERFRLTEDQQHGFDWVQITARWRAWLTALAQAYAEGDARVDPKLPRTCRTCHLGTFCRVRPALEPETEADAEVEGVDRA